MLKNSPRSELGEFFLKLFINNFNSHIRSGRKMNNNSHSLDMTYIIDYSLSVAKKQC